MIDIQRIITDKVGEDKLLHFAFGGWLACMATEWYMALVLGFVIGLVKELLDKYVKRSVFDCGDWLATFLGSAVTAGVLYLKFRLLC